MQEEVRADPSALLFPCLLLLFLLYIFFFSFNFLPFLFSCFSSSWTPSPPLFSRDEKVSALKKLQATTKEEMWQTDLDEFIAKLDEVEEKEKKEEKEAQEPAQKGFKKVAGKKGQVKQETRPSAHGIRIDPIVGDDLKMKAAKAANAKANKANKAEGKVRKKAKDEHDEFDDMADDKNNTSLSKKLGNTPTAIMKGKSRGTPKKGKAKNPWSDSDGEDPDSDADLSDVVDEPIAPREKAAGSRRAAANIKFDKYKSDDSEESGSDDELFENSGIAEEPAASKKADQSVYDIDSDDSPVKKKAAPKKQAAITDSFKPKAKAADSDSDSDDEGGHANGKSNGNGVSNGNGKKNASKDEFDVSDSGSDFGGGFASKVASKAKQPAKKLGTSDDLFDSMLADDDDKPEPPKKAVNKRPGLYSEDESDNSDFDGAKPKKKASAPKKAAKKSYDSDASGSDFEEPKPKKAAAKKPAAPKAPKADKPKKAAAPKKKKGSDSEDDAPKPKKAKAAPKPKKKTFDSDDMSGSDFEVADVGPARDRPGTSQNTFDL